MELFRTGSTASSCGVTLSVRLARRVSPGRSLTRLLLAPRRHGAAGNEFLPPSLHARPP